MSEQKPVEFPPLLSDDEIDRKVVRKPEVRPPAPEPFPIVVASYPRIADRIRQLWGTPQCDRYLDQLLIDDRGNRQGCPPVVVSALLAISEEHQREFGFRPGGTEDWRDADRRAGKT
jgi:hypothetical protein